jgi:LPS-assembly protein
MRRFMILLLLAAGPVFCGGHTASAQLLTSFEETNSEDAYSPMTMSEQPVEPGMQVADTARLMTGFSPSVEGPHEGDTLPIAETAPARAIEDKPVSGDPVDLQADSIQHDEVTQTVTASGDVMLVQTGRIFRADKITYFLEEDRVVASGHVVLNEESGDIHYSEEVELKNQFKDGFVRGLKTYLADGSRFTAADGTRKDGTLTTMHDATYTPCEPCKAHPEKPPVWQIRASEVEHDNEEHKITYHNARFEAWGVPIAYTPYFSHPDGTIKRKSGFLAPSGGYKSNLGLFAQSDYYWNIAPDKDATIGLMAMTEEAPLALGEYRQRWDDAELELSGGITHSGRPDSVRGVTVDQGEEWRGHVQGKGRWHMNDKWRSGVNVNWASDDQYMRQYGISSEDVLENEVYAERFSGRDYAVGRLMTFQDIRVRENQADQPDVMPEAIASFIGEPDSVPVLGGRWDAGMSFLGLRREGSGQDMNRVSMDAGWERRLVSDYGFLTTVDASVRGDFYFVSDRDIAAGGSNRSTETFGSQVFPSLDIQTSYPMVSDYESMQAIIEPIASLTVSPNVDVSSRIPNEDSRDVQADAGNLFEPNRFPGLDRVEDRSHATYGVRAGLYGHNGDSGDVFLGQSYRLDEDDNPFPEGSGLDRQSSDIVGRVSASISDRYNLNYRFHLSSDDFSSERHEIDGSARWGRVELASRYLYAAGLEGEALEDAGLAEQREQIDNAVGFYLSDEWRLRGGATNDFGENPGLRRAYGGVDFMGQCWSWSLVAYRNFTEDSSGESDTEVLFSVGLKNLGGFMQSNYRNPDPERNTREAQR